MIYFSVEQLVQWIVVDGYFIYEDSEEVTIFSQKNAKYQTNSQMKN